MNNKSNLEQTRKSAKLVHPACKKPHEDEETIDHGLYSRQLYVLGTDGMQRVATSDILIHGLDGLGLEVAKNIVLAGVRSVTLYDPEPLTWTDLSTHYFSSPDDIGKPKACVSRPKLAELNSHVAVDVLNKHEKIDHSDLSRFTVVIMAQASEDTCLELGDICHGLGVKFIVLNTYGLFGRVFCDFGDIFTVTDPTGKQFEPLIIEHIEKSSSGLVTCAKGTGPSLSDNSLVTFSGIVGMTELNGCEPRKVTVHNPRSFSIGDTTSYSDYISGGICMEIRVPKEMHFLSYREAYLQPRFVLFDFFKVAREKQLHLCFAGLSEYMKSPKRYGQKPAPWSQTDARSFIDVLRRINHDSEDLVTEIDEHLATLFAFICSGQCSPMQSVIGAIGAQEVIKACTGKFIPIQQWCYVDATECLPNRDSYSGMTDKEVMSRQMRYDGQIAIFGRNYQKRLLKSRFFMPGAGAIGCELLKNFAMMGVCAGPDGNITITDMDSIERSNLNRQFLFKPDDISKMKALVAASACRKMNPEINIDAHTNRVGAETEHIYNDEFFERLDGVVNALDNVETRQYIDLRCRYYRKPSIDSGTMGTTGHVQVIIPHLTEPYSVQEETTDLKFPACTLKSFPYLIHHTLQWARDLFEGLFALQSQSLNAYMRDTTIFVQSNLEKPNHENMEVLETLVKNVTDERPRSFSDCVAWARLQFQDLYVNAINQILHTFPPGQVTESGGQFWSGSKRCPHPLEFDVNSSLHMEFIVAASNLRAYMFNIKACNDLTLIKSMLESVKVAQVVPKDDFIIPTSEEEVQPRNTVALDIDPGRIEKIRCVLGKPVKPYKFPVTVIEFEKDDDSNFHMDFITAASNLRAMCYDIQPADRLKSKLIAGKIIPAIATTTSLVAGLVCLELYKLIQGHKSLSFYRESYIDLAGPQFTLYKPTPPSIMKYADTEYTCWDCIELSSPMSVKSVMEYFKKMHKLDVLMIIYRRSILYAFYMTEDDLECIRSITLEQLTERVLDHPIPSHLRALVFHVRCTDQTGDFVDVPYIRYDLQRSLAK